jgi:hypothetical protein
MATFEIPDELNEHMLFVDLAPTHRDSFRIREGRILARKERLPQGSELWKLGAEELIGTEKSIDPEESIDPEKSIDPEGEVSAFWCRGSLLQELRARCSRLKNPEIGFAQLIRARMAVKHEWSGMTHLHRVRLRVAAHAWVGPTRAQREPRDPTSGEMLQSPAGGEFSSTNLSWIGGDEQIVIPNLTPEHLEVLESAELPVAAP